VAPGVVTVEKTLVQATSFVLPTGRCTQAGGSHQGVLEGWLATAFCKERQGSPHPKLQRWSASL
jgi:hypothetical protein